MLWYKSILWDSAHKCRYSRHNRNDLVYSYLSENMQLSYYFYISVEQNIWDDLFIFTKEHTNEVSWMS